MDDILFKIVEVVVMASVVAITVYVIPWLKEGIGLKRLEKMQQWTLNAVLHAEQFLSSSTGEQKKNAVLDFLYDVRDDIGLDITDEQLDILVESAVKQMKQAETAAEKGAVTIHNVYEATGEEETEYLDDEDEEEDLEESQEGADE